MLPAEEERCDYSSEKNDAPDYCSDDRASRYAGRRGLAGGGFRGHRIISLRRIKEVVEQDKRIATGGHGKDMSAIAQRRVTIDQLVVQDGGAGFRRVKELVDVLSVDGEGDVGDRDGRWERVGEDVEHVHRRSVETHRNRCGGLPREIGRVVPGPVVDLGEVQYRRSDVAGRAVFGRGTGVPRPVVR